MEITHKIFLDDLELALTEKYGQKVDILQKESSEALNAMIADYLEDNFSVAINGTKYKPRFLGREIQEDAIWCFQEILEVEEFSEVTVKNTILFELFNDQTNLIHIKKNKKLKSLRLYEEHKKAAVKF